MAAHCRPGPVLEIPGYSQASLVQSLVGSLVLSSRWCTEGFVCILQEPVSPVLRKFCNIILLAFKVKVPEGSHSLCWIPRLGNVSPRTFTTVQELLWYNCSPVVGCLLSGSMVGLTWCTSRVCCSQSPCPHSKPLLTSASAGDTETLRSRSGPVSCGIPGYRCTQGDKVFLFLFLVFF